MTDPVERVARALDNVSGHVARAWGTTAYAKAAIAEYTAWLTEQGVPVERLLSGEMIAIPRDPECDCSRAVENLRTFQGHMRTMQEINEAALDYAGNPPVTPEACQEPTGATDSEERPLAGVGLPSRDYDHTRGCDELDCDKSAVATADDGFQYCPGHLPNQQA